MQQNQQSFNIFDVSHPVAHCARYYSKIHVLAILATMDSTGRQNQTHITHFYGAIIITVTADSGYCIS